MKHTALIVDDEPDIRELLALTLSRMEIDCKTAVNLSEATALLKDNHFDFCLTDMRLPDGEGIELVQLAQKDYPELPIAVITAFGNEQTAINSLKAGAFDFLSKPVELDRLRNLINSAVKLTTLPKNKRGCILLGNSPAMDRVRTFVDKLSRSQAPVFISGESGTGKGLVAKTIHDQSSRRDQPFVVVNCGAIPVELMESEFFGHIKGSFTGADRNKEGLFQAADKGTLFLDEVADLPLNMQVKLLRAIQESMIKPIGGTKEIPIDIRILSATNKDLKLLCDTDLFRKDLYFRLNVIELSIPPLRERPEDIPVLAGHVLQKISRTSPDHPAQLTDEALTALSRYTFPGNIRELENILERAIALSDDGQIKLLDLYLQEDGVRDSPSMDDGNKTHSKPTHGERGDLPLEEYLAIIETREIQDALEQSQWNRKTAAKILKLSSRQLRYRMSKLGL